MYRMYTTACRLSLTAALLLAAAPTAARGGPAEDQFAVAAGHYGRERWRLAVEEFDRFLGQYPEHEQVPQATFFLAEALVKVGQYARAEKQFEQFQALDVRPDNANAPRALFRMGEMAYLLGRQADARDRLDRFRRDYPEDALGAYVLPYLAELARADARWADAQSLYVETLERYPKSPMAENCRYWLGWVLQKQGDDQAARSFFEPLAAAKESAWYEHATIQLALLDYDARKYGAAAQALGRFLTEHPQSERAATARYWLGMTQLEQGEHARAVETLGQIGEDVRHPLAADIHFARAEANRLAGNSQEAVRLFDLVIAEWPESDWVANAMLGKMLIALSAQEHSTVETLAEQFRLRLPDHPLQSDAQRALGRSALDRESYDKAIAVLEPLASPRPDALDELGHEPPPPDDSNLFLLALAYQGAERFEDSLAALDRIDRRAADAGLLSGAQVARASALMQLERYDEAARSLEAYLAANPQGKKAAQCRAQLAVALAGLGNWEQAQEAFAAFGRQHPGDPLRLPTTAALADAAYRADQRVWARQLYQALAADDNPPDYRTKGVAGLAWTQLEGDKPEESADTFDKLLKERPDDPLAAEAYYAQAIALIKNRQYDAALARLGRIIEHYPASKQFSDALLVTARIHDRQQRDDKAAEYFERLVTDFPDHPQMPAVLYQWAWALADSEEQDRADEIFSQIYGDFKQTRYWPDATYRLAERATLAKDYVRAERLIDEVLASGAEGEVVEYSLFLKGQLAATLTRWEDVTAPMQRLLDEFADSRFRISAEFWIAEAAYRLGHYGEAQRRYEQLGRKTQGRRDSWLARLPLRRAQLLARNKQWDEVLALVSNIGQEYPDFRQAYEVDYVLGRALAGKARFREAREAYTRAIDSPLGSKTETAAMAQFMIGESYMQQKQFDDALQAFYRVEHLYDYPQWTADSLLEAGKCHEENGQWQQAIELYDRILAEFPNTTHVDKAKQRRTVAAARAGTDGS